MKGQKANSIVDAAEVLTPVFDQVFVNHAVIGEHRVETKVYNLAVFLVSYPNILDISFACTVEKVETSVTATREGYRVALSQFSATGILSSCRRLPNALQARRQHPF